MGEKIKYFVYALIPAIVLNMIQAFASVIITCFSAIKTMGEGGFAIDGGNPEQIANYITKNLMANINIELILAVYLIMALIVELLVGRFVFKRKSLKGNIKNLNGPAIGGISVTVLGLGVATSYILNVVYALFPKLMEAYDELMRNMGLTDDITPIMLICTVIGAPLVEEIAFRGFTQHLFGKVFSNFWIANICQALIFGIIHGNIVQGTYAFCFGIVLGYIRYRYDSLYASILGHFLFNFYGTVVTALLSTYAADISPVIPIVLGLVVFATGVHMIRPAKENAQEQ